MAERLAIKGIYLFFDSGKVYLAPGLMAADGSHLSQKGEMDPSPGVAKAH